MKYALFGATGAVGKELANVLAANNRKFRVVGRKLQDLKATFGRYEPLVEYCEADLTDAASARRAADGIDTLFYLVGVPYDRFDLHPQMSKVCVNAAAEAGVRKFVHLGTLYSFGRMQRECITEDHPREPHTFKGRMRKEQEDIVLGAHGKNGMQVTILRAPDFYGGDSPLSMLYRVFDAAVKGKTADVIGPIDKPHEFIYVPDLARTLYQLSQVDAAYGKGWNIGGAGFITVKEFSEKIFKRAGSKPKLRVAGLWTLRLLGLFNPFMREFVEMHYLMTEPLFVYDEALRRLIPELRKTPYDDGIERTLAFERARRAP